MRIILRLFIVPLLASTALAFDAAPTAGQVAGVSGTIIVTNKTPSTATIVDVGSGRTLATLPTGGGPHEVVVSSDGRTAVVTDYGGQGGGGSTLTVIDVPGLKIARTISLGEYRRPHGVAFLAGDSLVAVTSETHRFVLIVNVAAGVVRQAIATTQNGSHMVGVVADASRAFTGNIGSNTVSELDLRTGQLVRTFEVPPQPEAINVTPDGKEVWVGSNSLGRVSVLDPATGAVRTAADSLGWPYRVAFTPDVRVAIIPDYRGEALRFIDRASKREISRIDLKGAGPQGISIAPNGRHAFLSLSTQSRVAIIDLGTRAVVGSINVGETPDGVAYTSRVVAR